MKDLSVYSSDQIEEDYGADASGLQEEVQGSPSLHPATQGAWARDVLWGYLTEQSWMLWGKSVNNSYNSPSPLSVEVIV